MNEVILKILAASSLALSISPAIALADKTEGYAPLGIRVGSFTLSPSLESENEWNDNIYYRQNNTSSDFIFHIKPILNVKSIWSRHALNFSAGSDVMFYKDHSTEDKQNYFVNLDGRFDVLRGSFATARFYYQHNTESRGSPEPIANRSINPLENDTLGATVGYEHKFNRLRANVSHDIQHIEYQDGRDPFGAVVPNSQRSRMVNTSTARLGYELFSGYEAYILGSYNFVDYPSLSTIFGNQNLDRSSRGYGIAGGIKADISHTLIADAHFGYRHQDYRSPTLKPVTGMSGGLGLTWLPSRLTTVKVAIERDIMETTQVNQSGFFSTQFFASVDHELMRNIFLNFHASYTNNDYHGTTLNRQDDLYNGGFNLKYLLNRYFYLKTGYDHYGRTSNINNQNYDMNTVYLTLGAQL